MHILIIGAAGMLGRKLTDRLVAHRAISGKEITRLTLADVEAPPAPAPFSGKTSIVTVDLSSAGAAGT